MSAVFLDLDGTLMDSKPGILAALSAAFADLGRPDLVGQDLTWLIGPSFQITFPKLGLSDPDAAIEAYRKHYDAGEMFNARIYDGVNDMISELKRAGHRLYLATAKPHVSARQITKHFGLSKFMEAEFGPELDGTRNWKGDLLAHALELTGEKAEESVMVGDRHHDIAAAASVGMASIAVRWGYGTNEDWAEATKLVDHPSDVLPAVTGLGL